MYINLKEIKIYHLLKSFLYSAGYSVSVRKKMWPDIRPLCIFRLGYKTFFCMSSLFFTAPMMLEKYTAPHLHCLNPWIAADKTHRSAILCRLIYI